MSTDQPLDVLVIAPHPDDAELGMAGAILKFKAEGRRVGILDLTSGEPTPHGSPEIRARICDGLQWAGLHVDADRNAALSSASRYRLP